MQISGTIPREISMLNNLRILHLSNTQISGTIPREISMLSDLQHLYLDKHADQWHNSSRDIDASNLRIAA